MGMELHDEVVGALSEHAIDHQTLLDMIARRAGRLLGEMCLLTLLSEDGRHLQVSALHDDDPARAATTRALFADRPYPAGQGPAGHVVKTGEAVRMSLDVDDFQLSPGDRDYLERFGVRSWLIVPLKYKGTVIGTLGLWRSSDRPAFTGTDQALVRRLADTVALAIANSRLYLEAAERAEQLRYLHLTELALSASVEQRLALHLILDQVAKMPGVIAAAVLLRDADSAWLNLAAVSGNVPAPRPGRRLPVGEGRRAHALQRKEPIKATIAELGGEPALPGNFNSCVALPLVARDEVLGLLEVYGGSDLHVDADLLQFLETLSARAAVAVDMGRLNSELRLLRGEQHMAGRAAPLPLSRSQQLVLPLLIRGDTNRQIAESIHLSENTVKFHVREILRKLGARNRVEVALVATKLRLVR